MAKGSLQIAYDKLLLDKLELQAENEKLKEEIAAALDDLPHKPDSAKNYLEQALKGK